MTTHSKLRRPAAATFVPAMAPLFLLLLLAACGGSSTTTTPTSSPPLTSPTESASPAVISSPVATPLPTPTVAGTIAFANIKSAGSGGNSDIYVVKTDGSGLEQLTDGPSWGDHPSWSPDGRRIAYAQWQNDDPAGTSVWVMNADGSHKVRLTAGEVDGHWPAWSPDGKQIAFVRPLPSGRPSIYVMNADGSDVKAVDKLEFGTEEGAGLAWAPDGRILVLQEGGVYAVHPDGSGLGQVTDAPGLATFALSPDGAQIVLEDSKLQMWIAPVEGGGTPLLLVSHTYNLMDDP